MTDPDDPAQPYSDALHTTLESRWAPPELKLRGGAAAKLIFGTRIEMGDLLDRTNRVTSDSRIERLDFTLRLDKPNLFTSSYRFERTDNWNASTSSGNRASWNSSNQKLFNFKLNIPGYPVLTLGTRVTDNYPPTQALVENGSSDEFASYELDYRRDVASYASQFKLNVQSTQNTNFSAGSRSEISRMKTAFDAVRQMPLGQAGTLQLSYHYDEDSVSNAARTGDDTTRFSIYTLNLAGAVARFPLSYSAQYSNANLLYPNANLLNTVDRQLNFTFTPPVPKGKSASLTLSQQLTDAEDLNIHIATQRQIAQWNYSPNPRTSSSIVYSNYSSTDLLLEERTEETEKVNLGLSYTIPGDRGSISSQLENMVQRKPNTDSSSTSSFVNLNNYFKLSDLASMTLFYSQAYSDSNAGLNLQGSNDSVSAGFRYSIQSPQGYGLEASWYNNLLRQSPSGGKTNDQLLNVTVTWQPQQNWRYQLNINSKASDRADNFAGANQIYRSNDTINATITYSF